LELSGFRTQVAGDDTNSSDEGNVTNWTTKKIRSNSPAVIVKPAYAWPNLQGSGQTLIFQTKVSTQNYNSCSSILSLNIFYFYRILMVQHLNYVHK